MTKCALKNCKNASSKRKKLDGVSYFKFPQNPILREKWRIIIAAERGEEFFKPNKSSVVCSDHFLETDLYLTNKGTRMKKKSAVPELKVSSVDPLACVHSQPSTSKAAYDNSDSANISEKDNREYSPEFVLVELEKSTDFYSQIALDETKENCSDFEEAKDNREYLPEEILSSQHAETKKNSSDFEKAKIMENPASSGLSSLLNTTKIAFFKKMWRETQRKLQFKTKQVKNLKRHNDRLKKRNATLKKVIKDLKKKCFLNKHVCRL